MSSKRFSPTAAALRSSRFFSLPPPLQRPPEYAAANTFNPSSQSDTATLPHPVQQAVATYPSSAARGDWGLKRSLPRRSIRRTGNPIFRIHAVDTHEHITDFDSALDLTKAREKFAELGVPLTIQEHRGQPSRSAFEPSLDSTDKAAPRIDPYTKREVHRWKFEGPWLGGLTENQFLSYVSKELRGRRTEFLAYVRAHEDSKQQANRQHAATAAYGRRHPHSRIPMTDEDFDAFLRNLRADFSSISELAQLISRFLDLPQLVPATEGSSKTSNFERNASSPDTIINAQRTLSSGPPSTHPSGGLSYLRSDAILPNHSIFGPLAHSEPHLARVLQSDERNPAGITAKVGVGGFVASEGGSLKGTRRVLQADVRRETESSQMREAGANDLARFDRSAKSIGVGVNNGNRVWVDAWRAWIDEAGRVQLHVESADDRAVGAKVGELDEATMQGAQGAGQDLHMLRRGQRASNNFSVQRQGGGQYGIGKASYPGNGQDGNAAADQDVDQKHFSKFVGQVQQISRQQGEQ